MLFRPANRLENQHLTRMFNPNQTIKYVKTMLYYLNMEMLKKHNDKQNGAW